MDMTPEMKAFEKRLRWRNESTAEIVAAVVKGYDYNPGSSDLEDEQPIHVRVTMGEYRLACQLVNDNLKPGDR